MRVLVTGASGFVGRYLVRALRECGYEVVAAGRSGVDAEEFLPLDLGDPSNVRGVVDLARAGVIYHLAAQTFVPDAIASPYAAYETNAMGTARLFDAIRAASAQGVALPRVIVVSSAEVYGKRPAAALPFSETLAPLPLNPYAASKAAQEMIGLAAWHTYGIPVIVTRAFNHIGPGQDERFVVSSFARQLAAIAAGGPPLLLVGNLEAERDFLDVRDVVAAYVALARAGEPGEVYNVCSGKPVKIKEVLRMLVSIAHVPVEIREDTARMRPVDIPISFGDNAKLRAATGWTPARSLADTLRAIFDSYRGASLSS